MGNVNQVSIDEINIGDRYQWDGRVVTICAITEVEDVGWRDYGEVHPVRRAVVLYDGNREARVVRARDLAPVKDPHQQQDPPSS